MVNIPCKELREVTTFADAKQVGQEIIPVVLSNERGDVAPTAIVPELFGTVSVLVVPVVIEDKSNWAFLVLSALFCNVVELSVRVLFVNVCVWLAKTKVSLPESAGIVAVRDELGAIDEMVVVWPEAPKINWLVVLERVRPAKVGAAPAWIFCGRESVISPVLPETLTWFVVPVREVTPELAIVIVPTPLVIPIPDPAVKLLSESPVPLPISSLPLAAVEVSKPVPPLLVESCAWVDNTPAAELTTIPWVLRPEKVIVPPAVRLATLVTFPPPVPWLTVKMLVPLSLTSKVADEPWLIAYPPVTVAPVFEYVPPL